MVNAKFTDITESHNTLDPDLASCGAEAQTGNGAAGTSSARRAEGNPFVLGSGPEKVTGVWEHAAAHTLDCRKARCPGLTFRPTSIDEAARMSTLGGSRARAPPPPRTGRNNADRR